MEYKILTSGKTVKYNGCMSVTQNNAFTSANPARRRCAITPIHASPRINQLYRMKRTRQKSWQYWEDAPTGESALSFTTTSCSSWKRRLRVPIVVTILCVIPPLLLRSGSISSSSAIFTPESGASHCASHNTQWSQPGMRRCPLLEGAEAPYNSEAHVGLMPRQSERWHILFIWI